MPTRKPRGIRWLRGAQAHDYPAAKSYLSLLYGRDKVVEMITELRASPLVEFKAKDIFRASGLSLLGVSNSHVEKDRAKIRRGEAISPLLLVRDKQNGRVVIADGYHRLCAIYGFNEDAVIPCKIV